MGEIKSTLELAMERTRHLVPTREDREELARRENEEKLRILVRRLLEGQLSPEGGRREICDLEAERRDFPWRQNACRECIRGASPGDRAQKALAALGALGCSQREPLDGLVRRFQGDEERLAAEATERLLQRLAEEGISGSAVIPNVQADPAWQEAHAVIERAFAEDRDRLAGIAENGAQASAAS